MFRHLGYHLKQMRISHYIKNGLIFFPIFFARHINVYNELIDTIIAYFSFCLMCSAVYYINDLMDKKYDVLNANKKMRPIASGQIKTIEAIVTIVILLCAAFSLLFFLTDSVNTLSWLYLLIYLLLNILYSKCIKHIPVLDVFMMAVFFEIRIYYGAAIISVDVSSWLFYTVFVAALYFSLMKRKKEIDNEDAAITRPVLGKYNEKFLDTSVVMCAISTLIFYTIWASTITDLNNWGIKISVVLVYALFFQYHLAAIQSENGNPVSIVFKNPQIIVNMLLLAVSLFAGVYFE